MDGRQRAKLIAWIERIAGGDSASLSDARRSSSISAFSCGLFDTITLDSMDPFGLISDTAEQQRNADNACLNSAHLGGLSARVRPHFRDRDVFEPQLDFRECFRPYGDACAGAAYDPFTGDVQGSAGGSVVKSRSIERLKGPTLSSTDFFETALRAPCDPFLLVDEDPGAWTSEEHPFVHAFTPQKHFTRELHIDPLPFRNSFFDEIPAMARDPFSVNQGESVFNIEALLKMLYLPTNSTDVFRQHFDSTICLFLDGFSEALLHPKSGSPPDPTGNNYLSKSVKKKKKRKVNKEAN